MSTSDTPEPTDWLTLKQAGELFPALGERYLRRLVNERRIPFFKPNGLKGRTLVLRRDIEAFLERSKYTAAGAA